MNKMIKYPKIGQFRNAVANINREITFTGLDEDGNATYDPSIPKPTLTFKGTVKIHGSNCGISYNSKDGMYTQSRNNSFDMHKQPDSHMGFTFFVKQNKDIFAKFFENIFKVNEISPDEFTATIYGEWAGKGIQKGVGISNIEKSMFIFGVKISKQSDPDVDSYWVDYNYSLPEKRIYNVDDFETFNVDVDFNMPQLAQNKFIELVEYVEKECPVAREFGFSGIGEGIVFTTTYKNKKNIFKIKGSKHSVSKVKTVASVDVEKLNSIIEFVEYAVTKPRFEQAIAEVFGSYEKMDVKQMGEFIRWMINDIMSEELDTMTKNELVPKDVNKYVSTKTREMFFSKYNNLIGLQ